MHDCNYTAVLNSPSSSNEHTENIWVDEMRSTYILRFRLEEWFWGAITCIRYTWDTTLTRYCAWNTLDLRVVACFTWSTNLYAKAPTEEEMEALIMSMDPDKAGKIDFSSFFASFAGFVKPVYESEDLKKTYIEIAGWVESATTFPFLPFNLSPLVGPSFPSSVSASLC